MKAEPESIIRQVPLFAHLGNTEIALLTTILREVEIPAGTLLFLEGDPGDRFYTILDGEASIVKSLATSDELVIATRRAGEFFGEMSLIESGGLRTASARAMTPLRVLEMTRSDFDAMLQQSPALALGIIRVLSLRLDQSHISTIASLREKNRQLSQAYEELKAAQAQIIEKERLEKELETARWIQKSILPTTLPQQPGFDLGAFLTPARAVGGDLYDLFPVGPDALGIVIGDVSDKGVPAAIFMALTYSLLRAEAARSTSPAQVLQSVNQLLGGLNSSGMFVTVLYGVLDCAQRRFAYARAGHELPVHLGPAGEERAITQGTGLPLGMMPFPVLDEQCLAIEPGDVLLLYTDGATDLTNAQGERFGRERLQELIRLDRSGSAQAMCDSLWAAMAGYQGAAAQFDDVALVAIRAS
jgi:sigma-B regulation protein RsbU (phosphoserine phosphatase)